jgi:hypothetical protein
MKEGFFKVLRVLFGFDRRRLAALAVLALSIVPVVFGICPGYWCAPPPTRAWNVTNVAADLAPKTHFADAEMVAGNPSTERDDGEVRPLYPYSVVPGGISSAAELRAATERDAEVRQHYAGLNLANARVERLREAKLVYVSYRRGNRIFWTRNAVRLAKGERVITDGAVMIRARCGNRISEVPMAPVEAGTAAVPAEAMELPAAEGVPMPLELPVDVPLAPTPLTAIVIPASPVAGGPNVPGVYVPPFLWMPTGGGPSGSGPKTPSGPGTSSGPPTPSGPQPPPIIVPPTGPGTPAGPGVPSSPPIAAPEPGEFAMLAGGVAGLWALIALKKKRAA